MENEKDIAVEKKNDKGPIKICTDCKQKCGLIELRNITPEFLKEHRECVIKKPSNKFLRNAIDCTSGETLEYFKKWSRDNTFDRKTEGFVRLIAGIIQHYAYELIGKIVEDIKLIKNKISFHFGSDMYKSRRENILKFLDDIEKVEIKTA